MDKKEDKSSITGEGPFITAFDLYLFGEGNHLRIFEKLGSHIIERNGLTGVHFAVWAPNAEEVSVIGSFNDWDPARSRMQCLDSSGIWTTFIPKIGKGALYKYHIRSKINGFVRVKTDPYGFFFEERPKTATIIWPLDRYKWNDMDWVEARTKTDQLKKPLSIYEVHLGSWMKREDGGFLTYRELAEKLIPYAKDLGFTHLEILPIMEHPLDASWGYQSTGYFAPTSRFGRPEDFMFFVDSCHQAGIGVILDWVPGHFPKDDHALRFFDGTALYEHADPRKSEHKEWGTLIFNYGRYEVRNFLLSSAYFWLDRYHIDGLRVDAVASMLYLDYAKNEGEWVPNIYGGKENLEAIDFLKRFNETAHLYFPGIVTIAEESTAWPGVSRPTYLGGLGFTMKWNMGWMHDTLEYFSKDPVHRKYHHSHLTFSLLYAFSENFVLPLSHDEVVHGKKSLLDRMPGDEWQKFANLRTLYGFMYGHPGKKLIFMGGEFGQWWEWDAGSDLQWSLLNEPLHQEMKQYLRDLNRIYKTEPALYEVDFHHEGFEWIDFSNAEESIISFIRKARNPENFLVFVCNFTPVPRQHYLTGVPEPGFYREILNSDAEIYGGTNMGNFGGVETGGNSLHGKPYSIELVLPPLSVLIFKKGNE
ncbi:1,4-alpha-glucan branching enzyme GlgB [bacterium BMS3Bbin06]|nr:1,4-alpha-glucan branching enzyme GlgB [bacterium BMS3Bbin06]HDY71391.1 1,4-alpha-glucan branching protein GlgB [Nitrospirota bacterium]